MIPTTRASDDLIPATWRSGKGRSMETLKSSIVARGQGRWGAVGSAQGTINVNYPVTAPWMWNYFLCRTGYLRAHAFLHSSKPITRTPPGVKLNGNYRLQLTTIGSSVVTNAPEENHGWAHRGDCAQRERYAGTRFLLGFPVNLRLL